MTEDELQRVARAFAMLDDMRDVAEDLRAILAGEGLHLSDRAALMVHGLLKPHRAARAALTLAMGAGNESEARAIARLAMFGGLDEPKGQGALSSH